MSVRSKDQVVSGIKKLFDINNNDSNSNNQDQQPENTNNNHNNLSNNNIRQIVEEGGEVIDAVNTIQSTPKPSNLSLSSAKYVKLSQLK